MPSEASRFFSCIEGVCNGFPCDGVGPEFEFFRHCPSVPNLFSLSLEENGEKGYLSPNLFPHLVFSPIPSPNQMQKGVPQLTGPNSICKRLRDFGLVIDHFTMQITEGTYSVPVCV